MSKPHNNNSPSSATSRPKQCKGATADGNRCHNITKSPNGMCHLHSGRKA